jgi:eukaryotic-like serine/threonine-protein kinase
MSHLGDDETQPYIGDAISAQPQIDGAATDLVAYPAAERYEEHGELGVGGMGDIDLCRDRTTGRLVARKTVTVGLAADAGVRARFASEARVQAQLEHPAIVPVYDCGVDPEGRAFFTMKRVRGQTLEEVLASLARPDADAAERYGRHRLLTAFVQVCRAIDYAHGRGVVHRDLKPANVMLGPYGEVYVLDWGLAKVGGAPDRGRAAQAFEGLDVSPAETRAGDVFGTPAYMSPEQARGDDVDGRADVYALGAILFEILTLTPLHGGGTVKAILARVKKGVDPRPSRRAPHRDIPPELESACLHACAYAPSDRTGSAGELADEIEAFLSGDRDVELRRELAALHLSRARDAAAKATVPGAALEDRGEALAEAGRAIALAPDDEHARRLLVDLLTRPPQTTPPEVLEALEREKGQSHMRSLPRVALSFLGAWVVVFPALLALGLRRPALVALSFAFWLASVTANTIALWRGRSTVWTQRAFTVVTAIAVMTTTFFFGPLAVTPTIAAVVATASVLQMREENRRFTALAYIVALAVPTVLALTGHHPVRIDVIDGALSMWPGAIAFPRELSMLAVTAANAGVIVAAARYAARYRDSVTDLALANHLQSWQLAQLVPHGARPSIRPPAA